MESYKRVEGPLGQPGEGLELGSFLFLGDQGAPSCPRDPCALVTAPPGILMSGEMSLLPHNQPYTRKWDECWGTESKFPYDTRNVVWPWFPQNSLLFLFRVNVFPKHGYIQAGRVYLQCCEQAALEHGYHGILSKEGSHKWNGNVKTLQRKAHIWQQRTMCQLSVTISNTVLGTFPRIWKIRNMSSWEQNMEKHHTALLKTI